MDADIYRHKRSAYGRSTIQEEISMNDINVYYNAMTHAINIDKGSQITEIKMPANVSATEITQFITSEAFAPTIEGIISK